MTVYIDDMHEYDFGRLGRMKMSHMIADTTAERVAMAMSIGMRPSWIQKAGTHGEHFDVAKGKRDLAIARGAVPISVRECSAMCARRRVTGELGHPTDAESWRADNAASTRASA
ncbi:conserved hypothetical protein [Paraburkholderia caribensis]|uniref:DUF4031 domain-containing protein n=1 Tax=Paraburkholderia caribensis TaxID=75105 RepID=UPI001CB36DB7|nr:DUF4031 domain-containing protein [Paraburkholderia caribensis]CAG9194117.1 conserved hypothetical protein [Paraburkholderia caribensis]